MQPKREWGQFMGATATWPLPWPSAIRGLQNNSISLAVMFFFSSAPVFTWNSSTANVARPWREPVSPRSCSTCIATAVDDSASPPPSTMEAGPLSPVTTMTVYATTASVAHTWHTQLPVSDLWWNNHTEDCRASHAACHMLHFGARQIPGQQISDRLIKFSSHHWQGAQGGSIVSSRMIQRHTLSH
jgi:hypothetical protein